MATTFAEAVSDVTGFREMPSADLVERQRCEATAPTTRR